MEAGFWHERWKNDEIGFHQASGNAALRDLVERLAPSDGATVFLPLCGKSVDMAWLHARGCHVVGVELSGAAVAAFFAERGLQPVCAALDGGVSCYRADRYRLYAGDFFALEPAELGCVDIVCDRAALVALPESMRRAYAARLVRLAGSAPIALVTLDYAPEQMSGPPFAVTDDEVQMLFGGERVVQRVAAREALGEESGLRRRGLTSLRETAWLLTPSV